MFGDNGKLNDNMLMHVLSPYSAHRSALTDCGKLIRSSLPSRKAIVIFGYDYNDWPMDPSIEAFETLASQRVILGDQHAAAYDHLVHPVHQRGRVSASADSGMCARSPECWLCINIGPWPLRASVLGGLNVSPPFAVR